MSGERERLGRSLVDIKSLVKVPILGVGTYAIYPR